eukprot:4174320-Prymnesium_polylepis.1
MAQAMELMAMTACDEQPTSAAPRVAAAAEPHKLGGRWRRERRLKRLLESAGSWRRAARTRA